MARTKKKPVAATANKTKIAHGFSTSTMITPMTNVAPARVLSIPSFLSSMGRLHQGNRVRLFANLNCIALGIGDLHTLFKQPLSSKNNQVTV
jgi:hypothetical protein